MRTSTKDAAQGKWRSILTSFGVDQAFLRNVHGPCPLCGGKDRFRWDDKDGHGTYFCSSCGAGDGFALLQAHSGKPFSDVAAEIDRIVHNIQPESRPRPSTNATVRLKRIGSELLELTGDDPASRYLASREIVGVDTSCLRWHKSLPYFEAGPSGRVECTGSYPAMVAALRQPGGPIESFHATYLDRHGRGKADVGSPKKLLGKRSEKIDGCAIRLTHDVPERMALAEGIENALSIATMYGFAAWAAYSAHAMATWVPPEGVKEVVICADADHHFVGQHAATTLATRLAKMGIQTDLAPFLAKGRDYNDLLRGKA